MNTGATQVGKPYTASEQDIKELDYQRYHHPHPRVQRKMEALLLKAKGLPHHQIASCVRVCENTARSYFQQYGDHSKAGANCLLGLPPLWNGLLKKETIPKRGQTDRLLKGGITSSSLLKENSHQHSRGNYSLSMSKACLASEEQRNEKAR